MVIQQLKHDRYNALLNALTTKAHLAPLDASYTVSMTVDDAEYLLRLQPENNNKIALLQAVRVDRGQTPPRFELLTGFIRLSALLEIYLYQNAA